MLGLVAIMILALFVEAVVQIFKPIWDESATPIAVPEWVSMGVGVLIAILAKINMLDGLIEVNSIALIYLFYVFTGIALGRGPYFVHDLWTKMRKTE